MHVFDHHNGSVDHCANGDGDAASDMMLALTPCCS